MLTDQDTIHEFEQVLGEPFCVGEGYAIYCADCLSSLRLLPPSVFDLTITSPPYNIGKEYEQPLPMEQYLAWCEEWMTELHRTTKPVGVFWLNVAYVSLEGRGEGDSAAVSVVGPLSVPPDSGDGLELRSGGRGVIVLDTESRL